MQVQISEIKINPQINNSDIKLSEHNQISLQKSESSNFLDMISSYQKESKTENVEEKTRNPVKTEKVENEKSEKVAEVDQKAESPEAEKSEKLDKSDKNQKTEKSQSEENVKISEKTISKIEETKGEKEKGKVSKKSEKKEIVKEDISLVYDLITVLIMNESGVGDMSHKLLWEVE